MASEWPSDVLLAPCSARLLPVHFTPRLKVESLPPLPCSRPDVTAPQGMGGPPRPRARNARTTQHSPLDASLVRPRVYS